MSGNPYAPSENWNTGESRPGGVPLWALLVTCLATLALGCVGGIVGGLAVGVGVGKSVATAEGALQSEYDFPAAAVLARVVEPATEGGNRTLEVIIGNNTESPFGVENIDVYHSLATDREIVGTEPSFLTSEVIPEYDDPERVYTSFLFDEFVIQPGRSIVVRFTLSEAVTPDRSGDIDVWVGRGYYSAHAHVSDEQAARSMREPGY